MKGHRTHGRLRAISRRAAGSVPWGRDGGRVASGQGCPAAVSMMIAFSGAHRPLTWDRRYTLKIVKMGVFADERSVIKAALGRGYVKILARALKVSPETVKGWAKIGTPVRRRQQIAEELLRQIDAAGAARSFAEGEIRCALEIMWRGESIGPQSVLPSDYDA